jgi:hypothetical protein
MTIAPTNSSSIRKRPCLFQHLIQTREKTHHPILFFDRSIKINLPNAGCGAKAVVLRATRATTRSDKRTENLAMVLVVEDYITEGEARLVYRYN